MTYRTPIFVQAGINKDSQPLSQLMARWDFYGKVADFESDKIISKLIIFLPFPNYSLEVNRFNHLEIHYFKDSLLGRFFLVFQLRARVNLLCSKHIILVAGDNYISLLISWLTKIQFKKYAKIQIQFHGTTYKSSVKSFYSSLRLGVLKLAIKVADSIRIVSDYQIREIQSFSSHKKKNFVLAPIPISMDRIPKSKITHAGLSILILGRLHPERGIEEVPKLVRMLEERKIECTLHVVGDGESKPLLEDLDSADLKKVKVLIHGHKENSEVKKFLASSDLLISFAPEEGYGLALREAVLSGVHVIAKRNFGTMEAGAAYPGLIELFDSTIEASELISKYRKSKRDLRNLESLRNMQENKDLISVGKLVESWLKL